MKLKKIFPVFLITAIFNSLSAYAVERSIFMPKVLEDMLVFLFDTLPEGMRNTEVWAVVYFKFIFWIMVFAVLYSAAKKIFHDQGRIAGTVAFVMSVTSVVLIPNSMILLIFATYSTVISIVFVLVPFFAAMYFNRKVFGGDEHWKRIFRGLIYIFVAIIMFVLAGAITGGALSSVSSGQEMYTQLAGWMGFAGLICFIAGIFNLMQGGGERVSRGWGTNEIHEPETATTPERPAGETRAERRAREALERAQQRRENTDTAIDRDLAGLANYENVDLKLTHNLINFLNYIITVLNNLGSYIRGTQRSFDVLKDRVAELIRVIKTKIGDYNEQHIKDLKEKGGMINGLIKKLRDLANVDKSEAKDYVQIIQELERTHANTFGAAAPQVSKGLEENKKKAAEKQRLAAYCETLARRLEQAIRMEQGKEFGSKFNEDITKGIQQLEGVIAERWIPQNGFKAARDAFKKALALKEYELKLDAYFDKIERMSVPSTGPSAVPLRGGGTRDQVKKI